MKQGITAVPERCVEYDCMLDDKYCQLRLYADIETSINDTGDTTTKADVIKLKILYFDGVVDEVANNFEHYLNLARSIELAALKKEVIAALTTELARTDYKALKYAEGKISAADYVPIDEAREALRIKIRTVENASTMTKVEAILNG